jgi:hypothetical protein
VIEDKTIKYHGNCEYLKKQGIDIEHMLRPIENENHNKDDDIMKIIDEEEESQDHHQDSYKETVRSVSHEEIEHGDEKKVSAKKVDETKETVDKGNLKLKDWWNFYKFGTGIIGFLLIISFTVAGAFLFI